MASEKQSRAFLGILYPDSESYVCENVLFRLEDSFDEVSYITHDMDVDANGELKKPHIHWVGKRRTPAPLSTISNALKIPDRDIEFCKSYKYSLRYLVHADNPEKYQYDPKSVISNINYAAILANKTDALKSKQIFDFVLSNPSIEIEELMSWCFENDLWSEFRRNWALWNNILNKNHVKG